MDFTAFEMNLMREWFNTVQDLNPKYLSREDALLAIKIHDALGARVSSDLHQLSQP